MEAVGQLTGGIAHDFNNLLGIIIGNLDELAEQVPASARPLVDAAIRASEKGAALTHRLLAYARKQTLRPREIDLNALVTDMEELLRRAIGGSVEISFALTRDISPVLADKEQLESAIINLAINARDAMPEGGVLKISTGRTPILDREIATEQRHSTADHVVLCVTDTGCGMTPEVLKRVTEPFFTTKDAGKGSGLGLSMVDGFAKQSGGTLQLESEVGCGTTARILLPVAPKSASAVEKAISLRSVAPRGQERI